MKTVLLIDDDDDYRESIKLVLEKEEVDVVDADCPDTAFSLLKRSGVEPDLIVLDLHMPFSSTAVENEFVTSYEVGVKTAQELQWVYPDTPVMVLTGLGSFDLVKVKQMLSPVPAYTKPGKMKDVVELIGTYLISQDYGGVN